MLSTAASSNRPDNPEQIEKWIAEMTISEKVNFCHGITNFTSGGCERLGIPPLVMSDGPHGVREELHPDNWQALELDSDFSTCLPVLTTLAATWNRDLATTFGQVLGSEARARGKDVILGPGVNLHRTPLCGRNYEYLSEDPFLTASLAPIVIKAIQEQDTAACVKHFVANSHDGNRHQTSACPDERTLREIYLPAFEAAVKDGGIWTLMAAYNKLHGQWCCHNKWLLQTLLKDEWGFDGVVISDWGGVHVGYEARRNGLDIEMGSGANYDQYALAKQLQTEVENGAIPESELDDHVRRILTTMWRIGMFDKNRRAGQINTPEHRQAALKIAEEGIVLLRNNISQLPWDVSKLRKIAVIGENATRLQAPGGGSSGIKTADEISVLAGLRNKLTDVEIVYAQGYDSNCPDNTKLIDEAMQISNNCDAILFVGGLNHDIHRDSEGTDKLDLKLPGAQDILLTRLLKERKNVTVLLVAGSAVEMPWSNLADTIVWSGYCGTCAGDAVANVLTGAVNPSGKLPYTLPCQLADTAPAALNDSCDYGQLYKEGVFIGYRWFDRQAIAPLFPFGHGLSYTDFEYSNLQIKKCDNCNFQATIQIKNTGKVAGKEVVQIYIQDVVCSSARPLRELKGFAKVELAAGESKVVTINLPATCFRFWDVNSGDWTIEPGQFRIYAGASSRDLRCVTTIDI